MTLSACPVKTMVLRITWDWQLSLSLQEGSVRLDELLRL